ncbi:unnamed protein product [Soboliphyme baturini]|uniref:Dickkopf_N domain-containing protein n=1 Tax=Soboliphyme baturini TaxID=241478 RepID=A0A183IMN3_9BILA|nr:unnamed protein product [Soboliphyme baturini]
MRRPGCRIVILWICFAVLLSKRLAMASFWNWLITNPHDVEIDTVAVVHHKILTSTTASSNGKDDSQPSTTPVYLLPISHPRTLQKPPKTYDLPVVNEDHVSPIDFLSPADESQSTDQKLLRHEYIEVICQRDRDCRVGEFCDLHYGVCKRYRSEKQPCRTDGQCATGLDCMFGRCRPNPKPGHKGARCTSVKECLQGLCCARQHGAKVCKPKLKFGQKCFIPDGGLSYWLNEICPCESGLLCGYVELTHNTTGGAVRPLEWSGRNEVQAAFVVVTAAADSLDRPSLNATPTSRWLDATTDLPSGNILRIRGPCDRTRFCAHCTICGVHTAVWIKVKVRANSSLFHVKALSLFVCIND